MNSTGQNQTTYEAASRVILDSYPRPGDQRPPPNQQQQQQQLNNPSGVTNGIGPNQLGQPRPNRNRGGQPRWNLAGIYTSAERRLPFVHRFRGLPPQPGQVPPRRPQGPPKPSMSTYETNPVGALQERFQSRGIVPTFEIIQSEGASHCPTFTFQVHVAEMTATGSGNSKKQAKHAAARAMLDKLDGRESSAVPQVAPTAPVTTATEPDAAKTEIKDASKGEQAGNPIGELQEFCVKNGLPMPIYDLGSVEGQPHRRSFIMLAKVGVISVSGQGTSKKDAKKLAATGMLEKLVGAGSGAHSLVFGGSADASRSNGNDKLEDEVSTLKIETLTPKHNKTIQQFYKELDPKASKLYNLQRTSLKNRNANYVSMLGGLGQEQKFEVTYVDIEEKTADGEAHCLVQLSTLPVAVCYGVGLDQASANQEAARNALNYLKIMTKRSAFVGAKGESDTKPGRAGTQNGAKN